MDDNMLQYAHVVNATDVLPPFAPNMPDRAGQLQSSLPRPRTSHHTGPSLGFGEVSHHAENTLRRKTPNGTLNAGFEVSTQADSNYKSQQRPRDELYGRGSAPYAHGAQVRMTFSEHQLQRQRATQTVLSQMSTNAWSTFPSQYLPQSFPVMDSMLQQVPMQQYQSAQAYYNQSIPCGVQPSFHYVGPTASGGQGAGPYGPYWHDGTYVPYRAAAVRDPRHYPQPVSQWQYAPSGHHFFSSSSGWQSAGSRLDNASQPLYPRGHEMLGASYFTGPAKPLGVFASQVPYVLPPVAVYPPQDPDRLRSSNERSYTANPDVSSGPIAEYGSKSPKGLQRDKAFAWALQQYRELLAFIQHAKRQQQAMRHATGHPQVPHRPSFFPQPPRLSQTRSSFAVPQRRRSSAIHSSVTARARRSSDPARGRNESNSQGVRVCDEESETPKAQTPAMRSPVLGEKSADSDIDYLRMSSPQSTELHEERPRALRRSTGSYQISPPPRPHPQDNSPPSRATVALSFITELCQDSGWQWTEGMHLGGCLAYGLGDYRKAESWYLQVLDQDPEHLEALSNLAAALLALGRKQEAERHWVRVVKTAPSHFEAVEHLVGMLCHDHRSRDAIRVIEHVERSLRCSSKSDTPSVSDRRSECSVSNASRSPAISDVTDKISYDFEADGDASMSDWKDLVGASEPGFGSSGFAIPPSDNGRILALIHAKGNMLYSVGDNGGAAKAFEDAVLIAVGRHFTNVQGLVDHILRAVTARLYNTPLEKSAALSHDPLLLTPEQALSTANACFPALGELPFLRYIPGGPTGMQRKAIISTTSNSLLSLAKIFQDGMSNPSRSVGVTPLQAGVRDILALYYLSLALQPSPSTANNVGILLAGVPQVAPSAHTIQKVEVPGVVPGSGIALALQYYNYGLQLDQHHAHLYTNLGSLLKDIGQLDAAITMYERAVKCDGRFDIALANLANAVKDKGRISDAIVFYKRAVEVNPDFAEAVCGLANALNSVCGWQSRGGIADEGGRRDRWHVDRNGMLLDARQPGATSSGWIKRVVDIVEKQLVDGESWGRGVLQPAILEKVLLQVLILDGSLDDAVSWQESLRQVLKTWHNQKWEGARLTRLVERATRRISWHRYQDAHVRKQRRTAASYDRPQLPANLSVPTAPTVLPFHTFTAPMSAKQIRLISQRNGLRISVCALRAPWLPKEVYPPPFPPAPQLRVGYVSSDFNNHPLAHLMQSVFGMHNRKRVEAYCYATTASDNSIHRRQIQDEAPHFRDASGWTAERLVNQIVRDNIHVLVNLNGYTRGARNEVFAARPAPIQMAFMGFAGTLGAEWCDYLLADETSIPPSTLRPWRRNVDVVDQLADDNNGGYDSSWVYGENIIYCRDTFFCCDHRQSAPDAKEPNVSWSEEQARRWAMRKELFPNIPDDAVIFGNFNQLYKIEPTTFRTWLRILARVPNAILWLLRLPDLGESHLLNTARQWATPDVASRVIFTDVAPKHLHISRARVCDLVIDTPECNAHTTAADVLWSGTPLLTLPRYEYKMCSRMAASILKGALPKNSEGDQASVELIATSEEDYEEKAVSLGKSLLYPPGSQGIGQGRLVELRRMLYEARRTSGLFDTKRWTSDLEDAYEEAWRRWVAGEGGDIWLRDIPRKET
ncbi:hypothetical protein LTR95_002484 [Oleoguttula sp. CCFEE 5521]